MSFPLGRQLPRYGAGAGGYIQPGGAYGGGPGLPLNYGKGTYGQLPPTPQPGLQMEYPGQGGAGGGPGLPLNYGKGTYDKPVPWAHVPEWPWSMYPPETMEPPPMFPGGAERQFTGQPPTRTQQIGPGTTEYAWGNEPFATPNARPYQPPPVNDIQRYVQGQSRPFETGGGGGGYNVPAGGGTGGGGGGEVGFGTGLHLGAGLSQADVYKQLSLEDKMAVQQLSERQRGWQGGGAIQSPTNPGIAYRTASGPYDTGGLAVQSGYAGMAHMGPILATSTGIQGGGGGGGGGTAPSAASAAGARNQYGGYANTMYGAGGPTITGATTYDTANTGYASQVSALEPAVGGAMPPIDMLAAAKNLQTQTQQPITSLAQAFKSAAGGFFTSEMKKKGGGEAKATFLGSASPTGILSSGGGGGFFGVGGTTKKQGRNTLLGG